MVCFARGAPASHFGHASATRRAPNAEPRRDRVDSIDMPVGMVGVRPADGRTDA